MYSKLLIFAITLSAAVSIIEATCSTKVTKTTPAVEVFQTLYHPCPRTQIVWEFLFNNGPQVSCSSGQNECQQNSDCSNNIYCCQNNQGCNQCIETCPQNPILPVGCVNGFQVVDEPVGCVQYACA